MAGVIRNWVLALAAAVLAASPALAAAPAKKPPVARPGVPAEAVNGDMSLGNPKAAIQVVEYASASCPHCAHVNETVFPEFRKKYIDTGRVRFTLREFLTDPAEVAAAGFLVSRCGGKAKYFTILDQVFRSQTKWREGDIGKVITDVGVANGLSVEQVNSCLTDPVALAALNARVAAAGQKEHINSTPTFTVNGKVVPGYQMEDLDKAIAEATPAHAAKPAHARTGKAKRP